ncbi:MAG: ssDNA-binding protein [Flavobacterium sp.]
MTTILKARYDAIKNKVFTGAVRLSFPNLYETAKDTLGKDTGKYTLSMMIPKEDKLCYEALEAAIDHVLQEKFNGKAPKGLRLPIKDGDAEAERTGRDETKGCWVVSAGSPNQPGVVDQYAKDILTKEERDALERKAQVDPVAAKKLEDVSDLTDKDVYAGCWVRVTLNAFEWGLNKKNPGGVGISFSLQNVQKVRDDESFSGRVKASKEFESIESEEDDSDEEAQLARLTGAKR